MRNDPFITGGQNDRVPLPTFGAKVGQEFYPIILLPSRASHLGSIERTLHSLHKIHRTTLKVGGKLIHLA